MSFHELRLDNGLQVIAELNDEVHSVAVGFFVRTGARDESPDMAGVSHFLEHMVFKGNERFAADDVNRIFDELGAKNNASTSEEVTLYYAAVLPEYLPRTGELLASLMRPGLRDADFQMEKQVILEEIGMYDDMPTFVAYEKAMGLHFEGHPLGNSILGTVESITALTADQMRRYHADRYHAGNITLVAAGRTSWESIVRLAESCCASWPSGTAHRTLGEIRPTNRTVAFVRDTNLQEHVMQVAAAPPARSPLRHAADLLAVIVGDDSGSRLYWELVDPGHAEVAELGYNEYDGSGAWMTYLSCAPEQVGDGLARVRAVCDAVNRDGVTAAEIEQARSKAMSRIVLRSERPMGRLAALGSNWLYRGEYLRVDEELAAYQSVTPAVIRALLEAYPLLGTTTVGVGPCAEL